jgi:hypothetical protein
MAVLFDAARLPMMDRNAALEDIFDQAGTPIRVTNRGPAQKVWTRLHHWKFGTSDFFIAQGEGLRLTRTPAQVRAAAPEAIRVGEFRRPDAAVRVHPVRGRSEYRVV